MTKFISLLTSSFILLFYLFIVEAKGPIFIPNVDQIEGIVENPETRELVPLNGGLVWLLCSDYYLPGENTTLSQDPCISNLKIYTPISILKVMSVWVNENGTVTPFEEDTELQLVTLDETTKQTIPSGTSKVDMELDLKNSYATISLTIGEWKRVIEIVHDDQEPMATVDFYSVEQESDHLIVGAVIEFNELVLEATEDKDIYCSLNMTSYPSESSTLDIIETSRDCFIPLQQSDLINIVIEINLTEVQKVQVKVLDQHVVYLSAIYYNISLPSNIMLKIEKGSIFDYAGNLNSQEIIGTEYYRPVVGRDMYTLSLRLRTRDVILSPSKSIVDGALVGSVASAAVGAAVGTSFAGSTASGGDPSSISLINGVQKLHLTGMLAVTQMPENYKNFTDSMAWAVLDFGSGNSSTNGKSSSSSNVTTSIVINENDTTTNTDTLRRRNLKQEFFEAEDDENELDYFYRIFFWVPLLFLLLLIIHLSALLYLFIKEQPFWPILEFPRLELMFAFFAMPIISIASAGLYLGSRTEALIATWLLIMFPTSFTVFGIFMIWYHFFVLEAKDRDVNLVLEVKHKKTIIFKRLKESVFGDELEEPPPVPMKENVTFEQTPSSSRHAMINNSVNKSGESSMMEVRMEVPKKIKLDPDNFGEYMHSFWMNFKKDWGLTIILGQRQEDAAWIKTRDPKSKLMTKYGPLFEEFRGPPVIIKGGTLAYNPETGKIDRGKIIKLRDMPVFKIPNIKLPFSERIIKIPNVHRFHLQILAKILDFIRLILVGCVISGVGSEEDNLYELISLLVITVLIIVIFRVSKPFHTRMDMGIMWLAESVDLITYSCAIAILRRTDSDELTDDFLLNIGFGLMLAQGIALLVSVIEKILLGSEIVFTVKDLYEDRKKSPFCEVVYKIMVKDGHYLERKYGDRWMVKTFRRGLNDREPSREELPWRSVAEMNFQKVCYCFRWFFRELSIILILDQKNRKIRKAQKLQGQLSVSR